MTENPAPAVPKSIVAYTALRIVLFAGVFGVCLVAGLETPISLVIGFLASSIMSFVVLRRQRDQLTDGLIARREAKLAAKAKRREALDG